MNEKKLGYMRVSTKEQNESRQRIALHEAGVEDQDIYADHQSGKDFQRPGYQAMLRELREGDRLVIKSIDRLGRNYKEILEQWRLLTRELGVSITVLDMPLLDTRERDLTGTLISDIVLQLLCYVAQTEREFIRQRQTEGIVAARARGVHLGRKPMPLPDDFEDYYRAWADGKLSAREGGRRLGISHNTFLRWCKNIEKVRNMNDKEIE